MKRFCRLHNKTYDHDNGCPACKESNIKAVANVIPIEKDYHNTNALAGETLATAKQDAKVMQTRILETFKKYPDREFTPCQIHTIIDDYATLLTSVRRSITNLTGSGKLIKTSNIKPGIYGRPCFTWKLNLDYKN